MKRQDMISTIQNNADKLSKLYKVAIGNEINLKKFNVAQALYAQEVEMDDVLCMIDTTLFGNGKNGAIITEEAVYQRSLGDNYKFYYKDVDTITIVDSNIIVELKDKRILEIRNILEDTCVEVFNNLLNIFNKYESSESKKLVAKTKDKLIDFLTEDEREAFATLINSIDSNCSIFDLNLIKVNNAINTFSPKTKKSNVIAFIDFSIFSNGKDGLIFENNRLTFKYLSTKLTFDYRDFRDIEILVNEETEEITRIVIIYKDNSYNFINADNIPFKRGNGIQIFKDLLYFIKSLYEKYDLEKYEDNDEYFEATMSCLLKRYQTSLTSSAVYLDKDIDKEKFLKAQKAYAKNALFDQTYLLVDSSLTGNSKNGCLITFWGIYSRELGDDVIVYFADIDKLNADEEHLYLTLKNGTRLVISNNIFYEDQLCSLLENILYFYNYYRNNVKEFKTNRSKFNYYEMIKSFDEDYQAKSLEWLNEQINVGNPMASIELAKRYMIGIDFDKDISKTISILKTIQGAHAYRILGEIYASKDNECFDTSLAEQFFKKAASLGDLESEVCLANFEFLGINKKINYNDAFKKYSGIVKKIEEDKLPISLKSNLGLCYRFGYGCEVNLKQAEYWLKNAIDIDDYFKYLVAELYVDIEYFAYNTVVGVAYLEELSSITYPRAMAKLGQLYMYGRHVDTDLSKAYYLLDQSRKADDYEGLYYFGLFNIVNFNKNENYEVAFECITKSAEKNYPPAIRDLGIMCQYGIGTKKDIAKAKKHFELASQFGDEYSSEWKEHTKVFLNKIKLINASIDTDNDVNFGNDDEKKLKWKISKESNLFALCKVISEYPTLIKCEFLDDKEETQFVKNRNTSNNIVGLTGSTQNVASIANMTKNFNTFAGMQGHGTAAEYANHVSDLLKFKDAKWLGTDNALNGADRSVNGQLIQTKFCNSYSSLKQNCVKDGQYKYIDSDGKPMILEVAKDQQASAERLMTELYGEEGKDLVKVSEFTTKQAKNISKFGNIDSLMVDSKQGIVNGRNAMGITMAISYATSIIKGEDIKQATKNAATVGVKTFGVTFTSTVISSQLSRTALVRGIQVSDKLVGSSMKTVLTKATVNKGSKTISTTMAKNLVKSNIVASIATTAVLSSADIARLISGRISKEQLCKNVTVTASGVAGGTAGFYVGAAMGSIIPVVGTFVGGLVGASLAGVATGSLAGMTMDQFIKNDGDLMIEIFNEVLKDNAESYLLAKDEIDYVIDRIQESNILTARGLRDIYASEDKSQYCEELIVPFVEEVCEIRPFIVTPKEANIYECVEEFIEANYTNEV